MLGSKVRLWTCFRRLVLAFAHCVAEIESLLTAFDFSPILISSWVPENACKASVRVTVVVSTSFR